MLAVLLLAATATATGYYHTDFESFDRKQWALDTGCGHCSHGGGEECTEQSPNATKFGVVEDGKGFSITTTQLPKKSSCGACATSGHMTWSPAFLYGNVTIVSKWYPGDVDVVKSAEGYIGIMGPGNTDCIYFGFNGAGEGGKDKFKTTSYAKKKHDNVADIQCPKSLSQTLNTFTMVWTKTKIDWYLDHKLVRTETNQANIPTVKMNLRLHSRSGNCKTMASGKSFQALFRSMTYVPL
jgi:beta-glucanase (GH16 family)